MNYLAHAYLSFDDPEILLGNLISDFVKGKKQFDYPAGVQKGIRLHRVIDAFTDNHEATRTAKAVFHSHYRLYSSAFVDVVYDHFLASDPAHFTPHSLLDFSNNTYTKLEERTHLFPEKFSFLFPYMQQQNWLYHYHTREGAIKSFGGVVRRAAYLTSSREAEEQFHLHYELLKQCYDDFFPELFEFVKNTQ